MKVFGQGMSLCLLDSPAWSRADNSKQLHMYSLHADDNLASPPILMLMLRNLISLMLKAKPLYMLAPESKLHKAGIASCNKVSSRPYLLVPRLPSH